MCHPETCNHDNHYPWWVEYEDGVLLDNFDTKQQAIDYCKSIKRTYKVKELTWDDY
jgi:hypothetical protein